MITPAIILMRPSALLWALAAGAVVVFYLRAIRPPRVVVARPNLWHEVLGEPRSAAGLWRRRRVVSGAIHVVIVLLIALAAADPCVRRPRTVVFVVDNSRSMEAVEEDGTRLTKAQSLLREYLSTLGPREYAAIVTTAGQPVVVSPAEQNLHRVARALKRVRSVDLPSRVREAIDLASEQTANGTNSQIHVLSDGLFEGAVSEDLGPSVVDHPVGNSLANAAMTRLAVRRYPGEANRFQVIVEVTNAGDVAVTAPLQIFLNGEMIDETECTVDAYSTATVVADLASESSGPFVAMFHDEDALVDDNRLDMVLPSAADESPPSFPEAFSVVRKACNTQSPPEWIAEPGVPQRYGVVPLWPWLVAVAIVLLAFEWALYHRRWTS